MADIAGKVVGFFKPKDKQLDNRVFKLFSVGSVMVCLLGSALNAATQYFGNPIECDFGTSTLDSAMLKSFCWIQGSYWVKPDYQDTFDCRVHYDDKFKYSEDDAPKTVYYQWVALFLAMQAGLFYLPYRLWKGAESGLMKGFEDEEARSAFVVGDEKETEKVVGHFVRNFNVVLHHNTRYFMTFVACEALNLIVLVANFYITDSFLDGKFASYGFEVVEYYRKPYSVRSLGGSQGPINPLCQVFPTAVSCVFKTVASGGSEDRTSGICILAQNIINEKIFLVLYFWYIFLFAVASLFVVYRVATLAVPQVRVRILLAKCRGRGMAYPVGKVLRKCHAGDWFVLNQICKNVNPYFYCEFIHQLSEDIGKCNPSRNKRIFGRGSNSSGDGGGDPARGGASNSGHNDIALMRFEAEKDREVGEVVATEQAGMLPKKM